MADKDTDENKDTEKSGAGRPLLFETVEDLQLAINMYFSECDPHIIERVVEGGINDKGETIWTKREIMTEQKPYLITGLARHLGIDRKTLLNYKKRKEFFPTIISAVQKCEEFAESQLYTKNNRGAQFNLNVNYGWTETQRNEYTGENGDPIKASIVYRPEKLPDDYWKKDTKKPKDT